MRFLSALLSCMAIATIGGAQAQEASFPNKPVKMVVPFTAGSPTDTVARVYSEKLSQRLGQPVVIDNRPGAGGLVASQAMLGAPHDGYTLLFVSSSHAINPALNDKLSYDTARDFAGIALVATSPSVVLVKPDSGMRTLRDFIALAKSKPGKMNYGSAGIGSAVHFSSINLLEKADIKLEHIPYKGGQEAAVEVMAGRVDVAMPPIVAAIALINSGQLRALAVTSAQRAPLLPDVPTAHEAGLPGYEYGIWFALVSSSKVPAPIIKKLAEEIHHVSQLKEVKEKLASLGLIPLAVYQKDFDAFIKSEIDRHKALAKAAGVKVKSD